MTDDPAVMAAMLHDLYVDRPHQMTLLDHFACEAMGVLLARFIEPPGNMDCDDSLIAETAYDVAEAMLKERAKRLSR